MVSSKYKETITEPQIKILQWLVSSKLYFIFYYYMCVISNINIFHVCYGHSYEKFPRPFISAIRESDQVNLSGPMLSLYNGQNQKIRKKLICLPEIGGWIQKWRGNRSRNIKFFFMNERPEFIIHLISKSHIFKIG